MVDIAKSLKGFQEADVTKKGSYLSPGRYVLKIRLTDVIPVFAGGEAFIVESEVVESSNEKDHPVGCERSWFKSLKYAKSAFGEMKAFMYAVLKFDPTTPEGKGKIEALEPTVQAAMENIIKGNRFKDQLVRCEVTAKSKKDAETDPKTGEAKTFNNYAFSIYNTSS